MDKKYFYISVMFLFTSYAVTSFVLKNNDSAVGKTRTRNNWNLPYSPLTTNYSLKDTTWPLNIRALGHKGTNIQSAAWPVNFTTGLDNDYYQSDSVNRIGYLYLETRIDKFYNEKANRIPLNLSIVIDRSGSMQGDKIMYAIQAAKHMVDKLTSEDFVSVVMYDQAINVVQPTIQVIDKNLIKTKIDQITTRGSTNLWGGTEKGYEQVKSNYKNNYINRVLLISDGLANTGITDTALIKSKVQQYKDQDGITLSTFGVGLDYNEVLMTEMAEAGAGNYYFINVADKMTSLFEKELNGLQNVAAQNTVLLIKFPPRVKLEKVFAFRYEYSDDQVKLNFRDLFSEEVKGILLKFQIPDHTNTPLKFISSVSYDDIHDGKRKILSNENTLRPTKDTITYLTYYNEPVIQQILLFISNETIEHAMNAADQGNYNLTRSYIHYNDLFLKRSSFYVDKSKELKRIDSANYAYLKRIQYAESINKDSVKLIQKANRDEFYKVRNKKQ